MLGEFGESVLATDLADPSHDFRIVLIRWRSADRARHSPDRCVVKPAKRCVLCQFVTEHRYRRGGGERVK